jgi:hypothetical protein
LLTWNQSEAKIKLECGADFEVKSDSSVFCFVLSIKNATPNQDQGVKIGLPRVNLAQSTTNAFKLHLMPSSASKTNWISILLHAHGNIPWKLKNHCLVHIQIVRDYNYAMCREYSSFGCTGSTSTMPCAVTTRYPAARLYINYVVRPGVSARRAACRRLLQLRRASGCLGTSRGSSRGSSRRSLSTTSPTQCVRLLRHVARLVA